MAKKKITLAEKTGFDVFLQPHAPGGTPEENAPEANLTQKPAIPEKKDKDTIQISAFISKDLYRRVKVALAGQDEHTLTSLLIKLLTEWERERR